MPSLNPLVLNLKESATLSINTLVKKYRNQGQKIAHFGFGQSPFPVPQLLQKALQENTQHNSYLPTEGLAELREAVADFYHHEFALSYQKNDVFIGPGSKELIFQTSYLLEGVLLLPAPSWVSYGPQVSIRGKQLVPIPTKRENSYKLRAEELDQACHHFAQQQKMLILNNPNNPTGAVYNDEELQEIAQVCRAYDIIVISDEIYAMIDFTNKPHASLSTHYPEKTLVSGGLSKSFAAGGYRLGVMLIPEELSTVKKALKSIISETFSAVSAPIQYAALAAYRHFDKIRSEISLRNDIYNYTSHYLYRRFIELKLNCPKPEGAFYLFPDFDHYAEKLRKKGILTGIKLAETLLENHGVAFLPGSDFYFPATHLGVRVASVDFKGAEVQRDWPGASKMNQELTERFFPNLIKGCDRLGDFLQQL